MLDKGCAPKAAISAAEAVTPVAAQHACKKETGQLPQETQLTSVFFQIPPATYDQANVEWCGDTNEVAFVQARVATL